MLQAAVLCVALLNTVVVAHCLCEPGQHRGVLQCFTLTETVQQFGVRGFLAHQLHKTCCHISYKQRHRHFDV